MRWGGRNSGVHFAGCFHSVFLRPAAEHAELAFANEYSVPIFSRSSGGLTGGNTIFSQDSLVSSMIQSFIIAIATTLISMVFWYPGGLFHRTV